MTDQAKARDVNEAAQRFAETLADSYRLVYGQATESAERQQQRAQEFSKLVQGNLKEQAEAGRANVEQLTEQASRQREAGQALARESVEAYTQFLNDAFSRVPRRHGSSGRNGSGGRAHPLRYGHRAGGHRDRRGGQRGGSPGGRGELRGGVGRLPHFRLRRHERRRGFQATETTSPRMSFGWCGTTRSATRTANHSSRRWTARSGPSKLSAQYSGQLILAADR